MGIDVDAPARHAKGITAVSARKRLRENELEFMPASYRKKRPLSPLMIASQRIGTWACGGQVAASEETVAGRFSGGYILNCGVRAIFE
jgi:hypothetical protein